MRMTHYLHCRMRSAGMLVVGKYGTVHPMHCSEELADLDARVVAAASTTGLAPRCPRAALFLIATLLGVKTPADFTPTVRLAFRGTLQQLAGPGVAAGNSKSLHQHGWRLVAV